MSWVQNNWNDYYKDKQWIDTKGWCDLDGNPIPFEHDDLSHKKSFFKKHNHAYTCNKRMYTDKVSFFITFLRYFFNYIKFFIVWLILALIFVNSNNLVFNLLAYVLIFGSLGFIIHFIYFIIRCAIEHNLRL